MLSAHYLEPITLFFHCLRLDNWCAVDYVVNLRMFLAFLVYKEQFYIWFLGGILYGLIDKKVFLRHCEVRRKIWL